MRKRRVLTTSTNVRYRGYLIEKDVFGRWQIQKEGYRYTPQQSLTDAKRVVDAIEG